MIEIRRVGEHEAADPPWWCSLHLREFGKPDPRERSALVACDKGHRFAVLSAVIEEDGTTSVPQLCPQCRWGGELKLLSWSNCACRAYGAVACAELARPLGNDYPLEVPDEKRTSCSCSCHEEGA